MTDRMQTRGRWERLGRPLTGAAIGAVITWFAFVANRQVPILDWFDLAVHEAGHLIALPLPRLGMFLAGSIAQVAFPLAMAAYFWTRSRDAAASGFCLAWAGTSAWDVSVYAGDAVAQSLPLVGGGEHDWAYILGPRGFDALHMTDAIAGFIEFSGAVLALLGIGVALRSALAGLSDRAGISVGRPAPAVASTADDPWLAAASLPFRHTDEEGTRYRSSEVKGSAGRSFGSG